MRIRILVLCTLLFLNLTTAKTKDDVLASNPEIAKYDSLVQVLEESYVPVFKQYMANNGKSYNEALDELDIPDSIFYPLAKSLILCNLYYTSVNKDGDFDIYGRGFGKSMMHRQIWRRLPKLWWELTYINGYILIEVLDDERQILGSATHIAKCRIIDDVFGTIDTDTILVAHIGNWDHLVDADQSGKTILIEFQLIGRMYSNEIDDPDEPIEYVNIYSSIRDITKDTKYCIVVRDSLLDKSKMLYKPFSSYSNFTADLHSFVQSIRSD